MAADKAPRPKPQMGMYDKPFWEYTKRHELRLQKCTSCGKYRWPPTAVCDRCLCPESSWEMLSGKGKVLSWVIFHRQYFPGIPVPYNCITAELDEGPLFISNLVGVENKDIRFDMRIVVDFIDLEEGYTLPVFRLA